MIYIFKKGKSRTIIHDSKLSQNSPWTSNQKSELIDWFKKHPNDEYITFEVRSHDLLETDIIELGSQVRIYRTDVWKSISNGSGGFGSIYNLSF
jgi:hypothetical protein